MPKYDIHVRGLSSLKTQRELAALASALRPEGRRQIIRAIGREFVLISRRTFGADGKDRAAEWAPLSKRYQQRIRYYGAPKLIYKGSLINSIRQVSDSSESTRIRVGAGRSLDYATAHQYGWHNLPARPYLPINPDKTLTDLGRKRLEDAGHKALARAITARL